MPVSRVPSGSDRGGQFRPAPAAAMPDAGPPLSAERPATGGGLALAGDRVPEDIQTAAGSDLMDELRAVEQTAAAHVAAAEKSLLSVRWGSEEHVAAQSALSDARQTWAEAHVAVCEEALSAAERLLEETPILDDGHMAAYEGRRRAAYALQEASKHQPWRRACPHSVPECKHCRWGREAGEARANHPELAEESDRQHAERNMEEWAKRAKRRSLFAWLRRRRTGRAS